MLRHAKSSWDDASLADHDRPLAARGQRAGDLVAAHLRRRAVAPSLILCSTSARTRETLERIAPALDPGVEVLFERELYGASADRLLRRLRALGDDRGSVMLIAHSSGIEDLTLLLAGRGADIDAVREKFPTGALATLTFSGRWRSLGPRDAELVEFVTPRALAGAVSPR
ncbi:MAG: phosphohistidine phosphatase [Solirubrobacteraceae bacterium]|nr:phosphohistidine phosphatase [Solirubrobacteraceae bacterium]